jgi:hypothetical protein
MTRYVARRLQALRAGRHRLKLQNDANDGFRDSKYFSFACDRFFFAHCGHLGMLSDFATLGFRIVYTKGPNAESNRRC